MVLEGPLTQSAIVGARKKLVQSLTCLEVVDLVRVTDVREGGRALIARRQAIDIPAANKTVTVARKHELCRLIDVVEGEAGDITLDLQLLLVGIRVERMVRYQILQLAMVLPELVKLVLGGLRDLNIFNLSTDTLAFMLDNCNSKSSKLVTTFFD